MSSNADNPSPTRQSTSDPAQAGPIPVFDLQLKCLSESYIAFFQERKRIEDTYIDSLLRLHRKVKTIDASLDYRADPSTIRTAWNEVRDNAEREAQTRQAFVQTLTVDIINPLTALRETQERTRKRIKEDLKDAQIAYAEYAENTLPKLKRSYLKKCQDVEDYKAAAAAGPLMSPTASTGAEPRTRASVDSSRPVVTAPQPLRPLDRRPSGGPLPRRDRSPSTSTALQDLAHQGKKQLNQLITFLDRDKSGTVRDGTSGRTENALRSVRAKRDADEADKEYRKAVHWLETLRIRRYKTLEAAYKSMELFMSDLSETMKSVLERYSDNLTATSTTQTQLSEHLKPILKRVSPARDASVLTARTPHALQSAVPRPVLYYNYAVGECKDLLFGVSLVDYATSRGLPDGEVPRIVRLCVMEIEARGLEAEGIYRVSGRHAIVQELQHKIERNEQKFRFNPLTDDVYAVASLLKAYLRSLPEPVFKFSQQDRIQHSEDFDDHAANDFPLVRSKMRRLPAVHQAVLRMLLEHLSHVSARAARNKMDAKNLAIVFGGVVFGEDELPKAGADLLAVQSAKDSLMEDLVEHAGVLFSERGEGERERGTPSPPNAQHQERVPSAQHQERMPDAQRQERVPDAQHQERVPNAQDRQERVEGPLPPAPLAPGEAAPSYSLGSTHTKVASVPFPTRPALVPQLPPRPTPPTSPPQRTTLLPPDREKDGDQDFTPSLPARPPHSIHPSARAPGGSSGMGAVPLSPTRSREGAPQIGPMPPMPALLSPRTPEVSPAASAETVTLAEGASERREAVSERVERVAQGTNEGAKVEGARAEGTGGERRSNGIGGGGGVNGVARGEEGERPLMPPRTQSVMTEESFASAREGLDSEDEGEAASSNQHATLGHTGTAAA